MGGATPEGEKNKIQHKVDTIILPKQTPRHSANIACSLYAVTHTEQLADDWFDI